VTESAVLVGKLWPGHPLFPLVRTRLRFEAPQRRHCKKVNRPQPSSGRAAREAGSAECPTSDTSSVPDVQIADQSKSNEVEVGGKTQDIGATAQSASSLLTGCNWLLGPDRLYAITSRTTLAAGGCPPASARGHVCPGLTFSRRSEGVLGCVCADGWPGVDGTCGIAPGHAL
jgi:hypothetical protein